PRVAALSPYTTLFRSAPVRQWHLRSLEEKLNYARRRRLPIEEPASRPLTVDRNLWGVSLYLQDLADAWEEPPADSFTLTRLPEQDRKSTRLNSSHQII